MKFISLIFLFLLLMPFATANLNIHCPNQEYIITGENTIFSCKPLEQPKEDDHKLMHNSIENINIKEVSIIFLLFFSFIIGIIHAFAPGHGKSIIISYLLGKNAKFKDLLLLSLTTAATHMSDILIVSLLFLFVIPPVFKTEISNYISRIAAILILIFGFYILFKNLKKHKHHHKDTNEKEFLFAGFLTGLAPCPSAWAFFLIFISLGLYFKAFLSVIAFTFGTIVAIFFVGLIFLKAKILLKYIPNESKFSAKLPIISALIIIFIGLYLTMKNIFPLI
ncbi:MAG: sulfite exporter TauE/SafE family protein [Nanoarchaeota archaeon]|nr:sulfite exporter TauE/SafE family protein [Nanoarchaeota archaeon]